VQQRGSRLFGTGLLKEFFMHTHSDPIEASTRLGSFIIESLTGTVIVLSALIAVATLAVVA
jgi:hypothetical protein